MPDIESRLQDIFRRVFDKSDIVIRSDMTAADVDGWDSISNIHMVLAVEKEFNVKFRASEVVRLKNVGDLKAVIKTKTGTP